MIKRKYIAVSMTIFILVLSVAGIYFVGTKANDKETIQHTDDLTLPLIIDKGKFNISDYKEILDFSSIDKVYGESPDAETALKFAKELWMEKYGEVDYRPYEVSFDSSEGVWHIMGSLPKVEKGFIVGGTANILIKKQDGKVLAVWHEK